MGWKEERKERREGKKGVREGKKEEQERRESRRGGMSMPGRFLCSTHRHSSIRVK